MPRSITWTLTSLAILAFSSAGAQLKIDSIGILKGKNIVEYSDQPSAEFGQKIVLAISGKDINLRDSTAALIYVNGVKMPCYKVVANCAECGAAMKPSAGDTVKKSSDSAAKRIDSVKKLNAAPASSPSVSNPSASNPPASNPTASGTLATSTPCFTLTFTLTRDSVDLWDHWFKFTDNELPVIIDIGTKEKQLTCNSTPLDVTTYSPVVLLFGAFLVALFVLFSVVLALKDGNALLRDVSTEPKDKKPFSLSRFQLFWWTLVIISSFILLFALRGHLDLFNPTALILLGISVTSTGLASIIDFRDSDKDRHQNNPSIGFWTDLVSDENGVSIHRYQNLVFTILFGIIFIYKMFQTGRMPDFGSTELILMGLSSAAYLTLKSGENAKAGPANPAPVNPAPVNPGPVNPAPVNPGPVNPGPVNPGPVNPGPANPGPANPAPAPANPGPAAPVNPAANPPNPGPAAVNPAPVNPAPAPPNPGH